MPIMYVNPSRRNRRVRVKRPRIKLRRRRNSLPLNHPMYGREFSTSAVSSAPVAKKPRRKRKVAKRKSRIKPLRYKGKTLYGAAATKIRRIRAAKKAAAARYKKVKRVKRKKATTTRRVKPKTRSKSLAKKRRRSRKANLMRRRRRVSRPRGRAANPVRRRRRVRRRRNAGPMHAGAHPKLGVTGKEIVTPHKIYKGRAAGSRRKAALKGWRKRKAAMTAKKRKSTGVRALKVTKRRGRRRMKRGPRKGAMRAGRKVTVRALKRARRAIKKARGGHARRAASSYVKKYKMRTNPRRRRGRRSNPSAMLAMLKATAKRALPVVGGMVVSKLGATQLTALASKVTALAPHAKHVKAALSVGMVLAANMLASKVAPLRKWKDELVLGAAVAAVHTLISSYLPASVKGFLGLGEYLTVGEYLTSGEYVSTSGYVSPEMAAALPGGNNYYQDTGADVYEELGTDVYEELGADVYEELGDFAGKTPAMLAQPQSVSALVVPPSVPGMRPVQSYADAHTKDMYTGIFSKGFTGYSE